VLAFSQLVRVAVNIRQRESHGRDQSCRTDSEGCARNSEECCGEYKMKAVSPTRDALSMTYTVVDGVDVVKPGKRAWPLLSSQKIHPNDSSFQ
jgi:hypothetical protein